jgi:DNA invertase Pin-like site-specific DNA recombinase
MKAVSYLRVSTTEQATEGVSLAAQESKVRAYASLKDLDLISVVVDAGVSGGKPLSDREGGRQILDAVAKGTVQAVITLKLDRLFRDAADCLVTTKAWDKKNIGLHIIDMGGQAIDTRSAMGRMFLTMAAGFAELEKNLIGERTRTALRYKAERHERVGQIPLGWALTGDGKVLVEDAREQEAIALMKVCNERGYTLRAICAELDRGGFKPSGQKWHAKSIARVLKRVAA